MDFCASHAADPADRHVLEQYRPYVIMMRTRARSALELGHNRPKSALAAIQRGIAEIEAYLERYGQALGAPGGGESASSSAELAVLRALAKEAESRIPVDPIRKIRQALDQAIQEERYEEAAALRDQLRRASGQAE
jgi:excinuclease UvrABC helicase subunit UvrB